MSAYKRHHMAATVLTHQGLTMLLTVLQISPIKSIKLVITKMNTDYKKRELSFGGAVEINQLVK